MSSTERITRNDEQLIQKVVEKVIQSNAFLEKLVSAVSGKLEAELSKIVKKYEVKIAELEDKLQDTNDKLDGLEQYSRRNNLRIYGIPENAGENTADLVISVCKQYLNIDIGIDEVDCSHRLGKAENGPKPIIIKFCRRSVKQLVYRNKKKLKGSKIVIREDLTQKRISLLKEVQKKFGIKTVWTSEGNIFVKSKDGIKKLTSARELSNILK